jgi:hypothetical protein
MRPAQKRAVSDCTDLKPLSLSRGPGAAMAIPEVGDHLFEVSPSCPRLSRSNRVSTERKA